MSAHEDMTVPIVEHWPSLGEALDTDLWIVRDDLLPFPLAGNKVRKISAELAESDPLPEVIVTNGAVDSNHCRTVAMFGAQRGIRVHLLLHGEASDYAGMSVRILRALGAGISIGPANTIAERIVHAEREFEAQGLRPYVLSGGGHTPVGARAFSAAGVSVLAEQSYDQLFVASGTGATQGGLAAAAAKCSPSTEVLGVSVARTAERGVGPVREAASWAGAPGASVIFLDEYRAGGYGNSNSQTDEAVAFGWSHGLPLDPTYTGKAFSAMLDFARKGNLGARTLFWHTGGLWNWIRSAESGEKWS